MDTQTWQANFRQWQDYADKVNARAKRINDMRSDRGWALAASVGIPRCGCSLHNASIDNAMTGWCARNPKRLKVAKQATHIINDYSASRIAETLTRRKWAELLG